MLLEILMHQGTDRKVACLVPFFIIAIFLASYMLHSRMHDAFQNIALYELIVLLDIFWIEIDIHSISPNGLVSVAFNQSGIKQNAREKRIATSDLFSRNQYSPHCISDFVVKPTHELSLPLVDV